MACTVDQCDPNTGLITHQPNHEACFVAGACSAYSCNTEAGGCTSSVLAECCGNGLTEAGEQCDDANDVSDDGCNSACRACGPLTTLSPGGPVDATLWGSTSSGTCSGPDYQHTFWGIRDLSGEPALQRFAGRHWNCAMQEVSASITTSDDPGRGDFYGLDADFNVDFYGHYRYGCSSDYCTGGYVNYQITDGSNSITYWTPPSVWGDEDYALIQFVPEAERRNTWRYRFDAAGQRVFIWRNDQPVSGSPFDLSSLGPRWSLQWTARGRNKNNWYFGSVDLRVYDYRLTCGGGCDETCDVECADGETQTQPCGLDDLGTQEQRCDGGFWLDDGPCVGLPDTWTMPTAPRIVAATGSSYDLAWTPLAAAVSYRLSNKSGGTWQHYQTVAAAGLTITSPPSNFWLVEALDSGGAVLDVHQIAAGSTLERMGTVTSWATGTFLDTFDDGAIPDIYFNAKPYMVTETGGYLQLTQTATDDRSNFSLQYDAEGRRYLRISMRWFQHRPNAYFSGGFRVIPFHNNYPAVSSANEHEAFMNRFGSYFGYSIGIGEAADLTPHSDQLDPTQYFDQWFDVSLLLDSATGDVTLSINGETLGTRTTEFHTDGKTFIGFSPYAWFTGAYVRIDHILIEAFQDGTFPPAAPTTCEGVADGEPCEDGWVATDADACLGGVCVPKVSGAACADVIDGADCDDGDVCTADDTCLAGACAGTLQPNCANPGVCPTNLLCGDVCCPASAGYDAYCNAKEHCEYANQSTSGWRAWDVWIWVPPGTFPMGCPDGGPVECPAATQPEHSVTLAQGYFISKFEHTAAQYEACQQDGPCTLPSTADSDTPGGWGVNTPANGRADHPANGIDYAQAQALCHWNWPNVGRLPSEAEWEFAANGPSQNQVYPWGDGPAPACDNGTACFNNTGGTGGIGCGTGGTEAVGSRPAGASAIGAENMAGNVSEWVSDCYHNTYDGAPGDGTPWTADCEPTDQHGVRRGGNLETSLDYHGTTWQRDGFTITDRYVSTGVRCAKVFPCDLTQQLNPDGTCAPLDVACIDQPDGEPCDDGDPCTDWDHCSGGLCLGTPACLPLAGEPVCAPDTCPTACDFDGDTDFGCDGDCAEACLQLVVGTSGDLAGDGLLGLAVPAGAVDGDVLVSATLVTELVVHPIDGLVEGEVATDLVAAVLFEPAGQTFAQPIEVVLTLDQPLSAEQRYAVLQYDSAASSWVPAQLLSGEGVTAQVSEDGTQAAFVVDHFSLYAVTTNHQLFTLSSVSGVPIVRPSAFVSQSALGDAFASGTLKSEAFRREAYQRLIFRAVMREGDGFQASSHATDLANRLQSWSDDYLATLGAYTSVADYLVAGFDRFDEFASFIAPAYQAVDQAFFTVANGIIGSVEWATIAVDTATSLTECFALAAHFDIAEVSLALERLAVFQDLAASSVLHAQDAAYRDAFGEVRAKLDQVVEDRRTVWASPTFFDVVMGNNPCVQSVFSGLNWRLLKLTVLKGFEWSGPWGGVAAFLMDVLINDVLGAGREAVELSAAASMYYLGGVVRFTPSQVMAAMGTSLDYGDPVTRVYWLEHQVSSYVQWELDNRISAYLDTTDTTWFNNAFVFFGGLGSGLGGGIWPWERFEMAGDFRSRANEYLNVDLGIDGRWTSVCDGISATLCTGDYDHCEGWCHENSWECGTDPCGDNCGACAGECRQCDGSGTCEDVPDGTSCGGGSGECTAGGCDTSECAPNDVCCTAAGTFVATGGSGTGCDAACRQCDGSGACADRSDGTACAGGQCSGGSCAPCATNYCHTQGYSSGTACDGSDEVTCGVSGNCSVELVRTPCPLGCSGTTCESCAPSDHQDCWDGHAYWYDSCGVRGSQADFCGSGEQCVDTGTYASCQPVVETLNYLDDDGDGLVDEDFRMTLYRRGAGNGYPYAHPSVDADHCFYTNDSSDRCMIDWKSSWTYQADGTEVLVYKLSAGSGDSLDIGPVTLKRLGECYHAVNTEHRYYLTEDDFYSFYAGSADWTCGHVGYVLHRNTESTDPTENDVWLLSHGTASDTMYGFDGNEAIGLGFGAFQVAFRAWTP